MMKSTLCLAFALVAVLAAVVAGEEANLLVAKEVTNNLLVDEREITVTYSIHNVGQGPASDIKLEDSFGEDVTVVFGSTQASWDSIAVGGVAKHTVVVRPVPGAAGVAFGPAKVTYVTSEDSPAPQVAFSSIPQGAALVSNAQYQRVFGTHMLEWGVFTAICVTLVVFPYMAWSKSVAKYGKSD